MKSLFDKDFTFDFGKDCKVIMKADSKTDAVDKLLELGRLVGIASLFFLENSIIIEESENNEKD